MVDVSKFAKQAKEDGLELLIYRNSPDPGIVFTGEDKRVPEVIGEMLAYMCQKISILSQHEALEVLQSMQVIVLGTAEKVIKENQKPK